MPARHAVLLTPSISLRPVLSYLLFSNSFPCHTSENSPVSPATATDPKTPFSKPFIYHTSETPRGVEGCSSDSGTRHSPLYSSPFLSLSCALFCATDVPQLLSNQPVIHSFHRDGGCTHLPAILLCVLCVSALSVSLHNPPAPLLLPASPVQSLRFRPGEK
jgi:hypothetical protein